MAVLLLSGSYFRRWERSGKAKQNSESIHRMRENGGRLQDEIGGDYDLAALPDNG
jgi:hypothetical protein